MKKTVFALFLLCSLTLAAKQSEYSKVENIKFRPTVSEECLLDVAYVPGRTERPVIVWFHGGGLTGGRKQCPAPLMKEDYVVVGVAYRLYPAAKVREILQDAAAAVAWVYANIKQYGGSTDKVYLAGHSAGGYITGMLGLDKSYLTAEGIDADRLAGLCMYSGQVITHFTERKDRGLPMRQPVVDEMAPLYHVRGDCAPILLITGDRNLEMVNRYEENAYFYKMLLYNKHKDVKFYEEGGFNHGGMAVPGHSLFMKWIKEREASPICR